MHSRKELQKLSEFFEWDFERKPEPFKGNKNPNKDLLIADVHYPFHHKELLAQTLDENKDAQNVWIAGDWFDFYSKSHYRKHISIDFKTEFREGYSGLWKLSSKFERIYLIMSNHDMRFTKWIYDNVPADTLNFVDHHLPERLLKTIPNLTIMKQKIDRNREIEYLYQHKNMIVTHIEKSNKDVGKTVQEVVKDLFRWNDTLRLKHYDMIIQAHNHQSARVKFGEKFLFQAPCLIDISQPAFNYVFNGKVVGNPPALGYISLAKYDNGHLNPSRTFIIDF